MIQRVLEPELMDSAADAREYDAMDHAAVNSQFVTDLLVALEESSLSQSELRILDLGAGTAQIPLELARRIPSARIAAVDAAVSMLTLARRNVAAAGLADRIEPVLADAKHLPFEANSFPVVISNSIVHHLPNPREVLAEAIRVASDSGLLFHRDLARPNNESAIATLVDTYAGSDTTYQRKLFADSLRAAITLGEMQELAAGLGFPRATVQMTSDRHWTWRSFNLY